MIRLIKSTFYKESETKQKLSNFIIKSKWLSYGEQCRKFEANFANYQGRKYCVMFNSGSSANLALVQSLFNLGNIKKGEIAAFSGITWSTNVMPFLQLGLDTVPVDVEIDTLNVSSKTLLDTIENYPVKVLFLTNLLGLCADIDKIAAICKKKKIILLEDNCEALGSEYKGKKLGNFSLASTFSFYVGHHMSTIEGGAVCTDDKELYHMLKMVRSHGWDRHLDPKKQYQIRKAHKIDSPFYGLYTFYDLGFNLRPTEINGFLGNNQLKFINTIVNIRSKNFSKLADKIHTQTDRFYPIRFEHLDIYSSFAVPVVCKSKEIRDDLVKKCEGKIEVRPIVGGDMTEQPFFKKCMAHLIDTFNCPNAHLIHNNGIYFGNNPELTSEDLEAIVKVFTS